MDRGCNKLLFCPAVSPASRIVSLKTGHPAAALLPSSQHSTFDYALNSLDDETADALLSAWRRASFSLNKFLERGQEVSHELVFQSAKLFYEVG